jgi:type IX secretion system PorP/SprF family membrane protein
MNKILYKSLNYKEMNSRKILLSLTMILFLGTAAYSQQIPLYNEYYFNPFIQNPARVGQVYKGPTAFAIFRKQWVDMPGAPETKAFTFDGSVFKNKLGLGAYVVSDNTGIIDRLDINFAFSYKLALNQNHFLSFGLVAGIIDQNINFEKVIAKDPGDPNLFPTENKQMGFDAGAGVNYNWKALNVGISVPQLISRNFIYVDNKNEASYAPVQHFILTAQYKIDIKKDLVACEPLVLLSYIKNAPFKYDVGAMFSYKDWAFLSGIYRSNYAVTIGAGVKINKALIIAYGYDYITSDLAPFAGATHEFMIGYTFGKRREGESGGGDKDILDNELKLTASLTKRIDSLSREVDTLKRKDKVHDSILIDIRNQIKELRVPTEKLKEEIKLDEKIPHFAGGVLFKTDSYELVDMFKQDLDKLAELIKSYPDLRVDLRGHTDDIGIDWYNDKLSDKRVKAVKNYLIEKGVSEDRITVNGLGERFPKVPNINANNRSLNRRVEIAVIKGILSK